jgi:plastocyanin
MRVLAATAAILGGLAALSCGGGSSSPTGPSTPDIVTITITRQNGTQSFSPNPVSAAGQMVVFRNTDSIVHRVQLNDGTVDTGNIAPNQTSVAVLMPAAGTNYHCTIHPDMIGAVNSSGGPPPACEGPYCAGQ